VCAHSHGTRRHVEAARRRPARSATAAAVDGPPPPARQRSTSVPAAAVRPCVTVAARRRPRPSPAASVAAATPGPPASTAPSSRSFAAAGGLRRQPAVSAHVGHGRRQRRRHAAPARLSYLSRPQRCSLKLAFHGADTDADSSNTARVFTSDTRYFLARSTRGSRRGCPCRISLRRHRLPRRRRRENVGVSLSLPWE